MNKPFQRDELLPSIDVHLEKRRLQVNLEKANMELTLEIAHRLNIEKELLQAKEIAEAANILKSEFLSNMSHEIRTPMNGVLGMLQLLETTELNAVQKKYLELAEISAQELLTTINEIIDYSKLEAGWLQLETSYLELPGILDSIVNLYKISIEEKKLKVNYTIANAVPKILIGDSFRLKQILSILVENAIKFTDFGSIHILVSKNKDIGNKIKLEFSVKDTGIGISQDKLPLLFKVFSQGDSSMSRKYSGTGIGLAICNKLTSMMSGDIWVESTPGMGSNFYFTCILEVFSVENSVNTQHLIQPLQNSPKYKPHILVVEDDEVTRKVIEGYCTKKGWSVTPSVNGLDAIRIIEKNNFDIIIMDIQMPEMDGYTTTSIIKEMEFPYGKNTPIIAMTAFTSPEDKKKCMASGMDDYLKKPVGSNDFYEVVERWLKKI